MSYVSENMLPEDTAAFPHTVNIYSQESSLLFMLTKCYGKKKNILKYIYLPWIILNVLIKLKVCTEA